MQTYLVSKNGSEIGQVRAKNLDSASKIIAKRYGYYVKIYLLPKSSKKTNPSLPKGKFIPCKAVKINSNGSVSVRL